MKVTITSNCMGDRNCNNLCAEVFQYDEDELKSIIKVDPIPDHLRISCVRPLPNVGADAIEIEE